MKRWIFIMLLFSSVWGYAQQDAWVYLTDKPDAATYLANPLTMLTQKSLDRRAAQNIALDTLDVPLYPAYLNQISNATGITVMAKSKWLNALHVRGSIENIQQLGSLAFVSAIQFADKTITATTTSSNARPAALQKVNKSLETQINYPYGNSANQISMLGGDLLHQQNYTGTGKTIAVLDAGFTGVDTAPAFQRLINNNLILGGYDFVNKSTNFYTGGAHGTLVLSTMGGYLADAIVGAAPDASYYLFITEDINNENPVEESYWVEAAEEADRLGVEIINTSLGYFHYDNPNYNYTYNDMNGVTSFVSRGADVAFSRGMICVTSAGNSAGTSNPYIAVPSDAINTLAIGAVMSNGEYATFSSIGPSSDLRVKPDVVAQGGQVVVAFPGGAIGAANGTSFSGPITAGMVACLWQALPTKTNAEMMQIIKQSAHIYNNPTPLLGYGIPNYNTALLNNLSAFEAITDFFLVYPNPVKDLLYIKNNKLDNNAQVELISVLGNIVAQQQLTVGENSIAVSHLPSGMYFCRFSSGKNQYVKTFIKL